MLASFPQTGAAVCLLPGRSGSLGVTWWPLRFLHCFSLCCRTDSHFLFYVCCFVTKLLRCVCIPYFPCCPEITPGQSNLMERRNLRLLPVRKQRRMEAVAQPLSLLRSQTLSQRMVSPTADRSSLLKERSQDNPPPPFPFTHSRGPPSTFQEILDHQVRGQY